MKTPEVAMESGVAAVEANGAAAAEVLLRAQPHGGGGVAQPTPEEHADQHTLSKCTETKRVMI